MRCTRPIAAVLLIALFLGAGCAAQQSPPSPDTDADAAISVVPMPTPPAAPPTNATAPPNPIAPPERSNAIATTPPPTPSAARTIRMTARQWAFDPEEIRVRKDDRVILEIVSTDVDHGIAIPDFHVREDLKAGTTTRVEFVASKTGRFDFSCSVFCGSGHRSMRGTLIVEPK